MFKKITAIMQLEGTGQSWECASRTCAACVDKLGGLQLSTPSSSFCQNLLTLSCPLLNTDIFRAEENHVKFMYEEGYAHVFCWNLVLSVWALLASSVVGLFCSLRRAYAPVLDDSRNSASHVLGQCGRGLPGGSEKSLSPC